MSSDPMQHQKKSPKFAEEQDAPVPVRPTTPLEEAEQDIASLDDPPKAEGDRDEAEDTRK